MRRFYCMLLVLLSCAFSAKAQSPTKKTLPTDSITTPVIIKNSDNFIGERIGDKDVQYFRGNVKMIHDSIYMFADSAIIRGHKMTAIGEVVIVQEDTINIFADSLKYDSDTKLADLYDNVVLESTDKQLFTNHLVYDAEKKFGTFQDTAILRRETMILSSLKGSYNVHSKKALFYDQVVIIDKDLKLTCDSLDYDTDIDRAYFLSPTFITQGGKEIYCEAGYYDLNEGRAYFADNAIVREEGKEASADDILFSEIDSTVTLRGKAEVKDSSSTATGDEIIYNDLSGDIFILGKGRYETEENVIEGDYIFFNEKTENLKTEGRSVVYSDDGVLTSDSLTYSKADDLGVAVGEVTFLDTVENRTIYTERLIYRDSIEYVQASIDSLLPMLQQEVDGDSLYVVADTLVSASPSDSLSYLKAVNNVKIYKSDLQAVCDSLYYSDVDSTFTLYGNPICWSDTTQFTGDTISILLKNDQVSEIIVKKNALIITKNVGDYYDQIKGRLIHTYMDSNKLSIMEVKGNAESLYLIKDSDEAYVGPNKTLCSSMTFFFEDNELDSIAFYTEPESTMTPMAQATDAELRLKGFSWEERQRPRDIVGLRIPEPRRQASVRTVAEEAIDEQEEGLDSFESEVLNVLEKDNPESPPKSETPLEEIYIQSQPPADLKKEQEIPIKEPE